MMFMLHLLEFLSFSLVQTGPLLTASKKQMNWFESFNYCKLSTLKNVKELKFTNVWLSGLYLQTPWMVHRGCFNNTGGWDTPVDPHSYFEWNITLACSYKCRKTKYFTLKADRCVCLKSLFNMLVTKLDNCKQVCNGSKRDPCGDVGFFTVYEQKDEMVDFHNVKCVLLDESLQYVPTSCNMNYSALCESGRERVLAVVAGLITITIAVSVILIQHKRIRKLTQINSRKSVITTNCYDMSWSG